MTAALPLSPLLWPLTAKTAWRFYAHTPLLRYLAGSLRHRSLAPFLLWLGDRVWTRQVTAWIDRPDAADGAWYWSVEHPAWLEGVTLHCTEVNAEAGMEDAPEGGQPVQLRLWYSLPTLANHVSVAQHPATFIVQMGEETHPCTFPPPLRLRAVEIHYRRRLP